MNENIIPQNEIDTLWSVFKQYKLLILGITLMSLVLSGVYAYKIHKPIYVATVLVQIGKENRRLVEPVKDFEIKLVEKYKIYSHPEQVLPKISKVYVYSNAQGILKLKALGYEKKALKVFLEEKAMSLSSEHSTIIDAYIKVNHTRLKNATDNLNSMQQEIKKLKTITEITRKKLDIMTSNEQVLINMNMLQMINNNSQLASKYNLRDDYMKKTKTYTSILAKNKTFHTYMIDKVTVHTKPVTQSKALFMTIGLVSGIVFSFLLAFFLAFLANRKD